MESDRQVERALLLQDVLVIAAAVPVAALWRHVLLTWMPGLKPQVPLGQWVHVLLALVPTWGLCAQQVGLQRVRVVLGPWLELSRALVWSQALGALALSVILVASQTLLNRSWIVLYLLTSSVLLLAAKSAQRAWLLRRDGGALALVVGELPAEARLEIERLRGREVEPLSSTAPEDLRARLRKGGVDDVVIGAALPPERQRELLEECALVGAPALVHVQRLDLELVRPRAEVVGGTLYLTYQAAATHRPELVVKSLFDRLSAAVLLVLLAPLLVTAAVLVRLSSPGPVLFVQERGGRHGRPFRMLKFRTMRVGAEAERESLLARNEMDGPVFKIADDPRVTPVGRLLRRTSVDELPQLVNVLRGEMSLVGPRPLPLVETRELDGMHRRRLSMRPGITGLWQVSGRSELGFHQWMALDLQYVDNWTIGLDLAILLRTVPALLSRRGAR
jgi:exopolysaccharide biosynthesis polyprenyl glycosylphosphotransferase